MIKDTGGSEQKFQGIHETGVTLRDHFAGQALIGQLSNPYAMEMLNTQLSESSNMYDVAAHASYNFADAMIEARKQPKEN